MNNFIDFLWMFSCICAGFVMTALTVLACFCIYKLGEIVNVHVESYLKYERLLHETKND